MKKKIVGIFVCMLLILATVIPVTGIRNDKKIEENIHLSYSNVDYEIIRDDYGVPHVYADTKEDLAFGMGYAQAEDRLWHIDIIRRQTTGRLAEFNLSTVEDDLFIRQIGNSKQEITAIFNNISSPYKEMLVAYVAGVNQYIDEAIADPDNKMPAEYIDPGFVPEYITVEDVLSSGTMAMRLWGEAYTGEELFKLINLILLIKENGMLKGWQIFNDIYPIIDPDAATTIPGTGDATPQDIPKLPPAYHPFIIKLAQQIIKKFQAFDHLYESLGPLSHFGSNAWVVSPEKSATGNALLLGGPQMGYSIPQQIVEVGLHGPDTEVIGVTLPCIGPSLVIGVSKWCAWTQTTGCSDLVDTYIERLHPLNKMKYKFNGSWETMESRTEIVYDAAGDPHEYKIYRTRHGAVLGQFWLPIIGGFAITRQEPDWSQANKTIEAICSFQESKNVSEFRIKIETILTSHNFLIADRYGNIGYFHTGKYPIRPEKGRLGRNIDPRLPFSGTGKEEWLGVLPFDENPQGINPPEGFFANWNNRPSKDWPYSEGVTEWQNGCWGENVWQIQKLLEADDSITLQGMQDICKTVADMDWPTPCYITHLRDAIDNVGGVTPEVEAAIDNWDCMLQDADEDCYYDDPGFTIFWEWFFELYDQLLADEIPANVHLSWCDLGLYHRILNSEHASLKLNYKKYLNGEEKDELIVNALKDACITLETQYATSNVSQWLSEIMWLTINDPVFTEVGDLQSPEKLGYVLPFMNRGTYNQIVDMPNWAWSNESDPPIGVNVLPCGQSGFVKYPDIPSPHAYDQLDLYLNWQFKPMLYNLSIS